jgi:micrococcal nuclease
MTVAPRRVPSTGTATRRTPSSASHHGLFVATHRRPSAGIRLGRLAATHHGSSAATHRGPSAGTHLGGARTTVVALVAVLALLAAGAAVAVAVVAGSGPPAGDRSAAGEATVDRVVDGDTLVVTVGDATETVRLIGIDTPESVARDRPDECYGPEASDRLRALLPAGTTVRLTRDVEPRDVYDRLLAYVQRSSDGLFVNAAQVADGFAEAKDYPPNTAYRDDFELAERTARQAGSGLWSACGGPDVALAPAPGAPPVSRPAP